MDGINVRGGRVEICYNRAWGTICNKNYGVVDAQFICSQLKFEGMWYLSFCNLCKTGTIYISK